MVNRNLLRQFDLSDDELQQQLQDAFQQKELGTTVADWLPEEEQQFEVNKIVKGKVLNIVGDNVLIKAGTSITLMCGPAVIHMNQAGVISITGTLVNMAGSILANVAAPVSLVSGALLLNTGVVTVNTGAATNTVLGGFTTTVMAGGTVKINP